MVMSIEQNKSNICVCTCHSNSRVLCSAGTDVADVPEGDEMESWLSE